MAKTKKKADLTLKERLEQALVPKAEQPYPVPENWCWVYAPAIFMIEYGKGLSTKDLTDFGYPVFGANGQIGFYSSYMFERPQALMSCRGAYSGSMNISLEKSFVTSNSLVISSKKNVIEPKYICCLLDSLEKDTLVSGSAQPQVTVQAFANYPIPLIPLSEQHRIVDRIESLFAKLDDAKEKAQAALDSFETRKAAILHKAFTGELTAKWREENGVGMDSWKETTLSNIVSGFKYGTSEKSDYNNSGMPVFRIPNITDDGLSFDDLKYLPHYDVSDESQIHENDILIVRSNGSRDLVGKCVLIPLLNKPCTYASFLIRIRPSQATIPEFLVTYLNSSDARLQMFKKAKSSAGINNINSKELGALTLTLPSIPEQIEIVRILDSFFAKERKAKELCSVLDKIDLIKKSILARAFRGELGTNDPTEESAMELLKSII